LIAAVTGGVQAYQADRQAKAMKKAEMQAKGEAVANQNALVNETFNKRKAAMGLGGDTGVKPQTGAVLTSGLGSEQNSILG
jgi:hypothetical protein